jgi:hypothetical protein
MGKSLLGVFPQQIEEDSLTSICRGTYISRREGEGLPVM